MSADAVDRLAELAVRFGANVQRGQIVAIGTEPGKEELTRALAVHAYKAGARFVDVTSFDLHVKRARILHADQDTLDFVPPWYGERLLALGDARAARIGLTGPVAPGLLNDLDPARAGRDQLPFLKEAAKVVNERTTNWTIGPYPNPRWAQRVHPELAPDEALDRLWDEIVHVCRLDTDDPVEAWRERMRAIVASAERLTERSFDAIHLQGPGTDLTVGLLPSHRWLGADFTTVDGLTHYPNIPTEEIFTTPDPERVDGHVRATMPLEVYGSFISGIEITFEGGRATKVDAEEGAEALRSIAAKEGADRLGELALVDGEGRIGPLGTVFYETLLDENAASHVALGNAYTFPLDDEADRERANRSPVHVDFMIGSPQVDVDGITRDGERVPVLRGGTWQV